MIALLLSAALAGGAACPHDRAALLAQPVKQFDRTRDQGWRVLGEKPGCERLGAELIRDYREANSAALTLSERRGLAWHEGQLRAAIGETDRAAALLEYSRKDDDDDTDRLYGAATVAFLRRDRMALQRARDALASLPEPAAFKAAAARARAQHNLDVRWPPNLDVVDGLIACFEQPYAEAYGCKPAKP